MKIKLFSTLYVILTITSAVSILLSTINIYNKILAILIIINFLYLTWLSIKK